MVRAAPARLAFRAYGVTCEVWLPSRELTGQVRALLPPGAVEAEPARASIHFQLEREGAPSSPSLGRWTVAGEDEPAVIAPSLEEALLALEGRLRLAIAARAPRRIFIHAGAVGWKGKAIVLPGRTLAGKSTLVAALVKRGATYLSDEYAVLDERGRVHPYPRPLGLRPTGSLRARPVPVETLGGNTEAGALPASVVLACRFAAGERWSATPLSPGETALALLDNAVPARTAPRRTLAAISALTRDAAGWRATRGEVSEAVDAVFALADVNPGALWGHQPFARVPRSEE